MATKTAVKKVAQKKTSVKSAAKVVAKKTVKAPVKKAAVKKTTKSPVNTPKKSTSKKSLIYAADNTSFWTTNGQILNSLVALADALDEMEKEVYSYHATGEHNDFASWVAAVLCDEQCAKELEKAKTAKTAKTVVVKHLKYYTV